MKLLKSLSLMSLALLFVLAFSCEQKSSSEGESATEATEEVATEAVETLEAVATEAMDAVDSVAAEVTDSASMEN